VELRAINLSLGVRRSYAVSAPRRVLAIPANVAELVAAEALVDSKVGSIGFTVENLGLPNEAAFAQSGRYFSAV
jgi:hypothetical protein